MSTTLFAPCEPTARPAGGNSLPQAERDALVLANQGLARKLATQAARLDPHADAGDLYGEALLSFVESARKWHPADGTPFINYAANYCRQRLRGRVLDGRPKGVAVVRGVDFTTVADPHPGEDADPGEGRRPDAHDAELLARLGQPARDIVTAVVFEGVSLEQAAARFDMAVKDAKLIIRNMAVTLERERAKLDEPDLLDFAADLAAGVA